MAKYLILDKSILQGTSTNALCDLARTRNVVLPETLFYECMTTEKCEKDAMLDRCRAAMLAGALFCPSLSSVVHSEARELRPYGCLVDREYSAAVIRTFQYEPRPFNAEGIEKLSQNEHAFVDHITLNIPKITGLMKANDVEVWRDETERWADDLDGSRPVRLQDRAQFLESVDLHRAATTLLEGMTAHPDDFCLSGDWITWHFVRVSLLWLFEREFCHQARGRMKRRDIEHDSCDMQYVTFLSRTEGLLMRDLLWQDIAKAAFPDKDVFSSLEEVPESYRCDRTDG